MRPAEDGDTTSTRTPDETIEQVKSDSSAYRKRATKVVKKLQSDLQAARDELSAALDERAAERARLLGEVEANHAALEAAEIKAMASSSSMRTVRKKLARHEETTATFRAELAQRDEALATATTRLHSARARVEELAALAGARGEALNEALPKLARAEELWREGRAKLEIAEAAAREYQDINAKRYNDAIKALDRRAKEASRADAIRWKSERARVEAQNEAQNAAGQIKIRTIVMAIIAALALILGLMCGAVLFGGKAGRDAAQTFQSDATMDVGALHVVDVPIVAVMAPASATPDPAAAAAAEAPPAAAPAAAAAPPPAPAPADAANVVKVSSAVAASAADPATSAAAPEGDGP